MSYGCDKQLHPRFMWETTHRDGRNTNKSDDDDFDGSGVSMDDDVDDMRTIWGVNDNDDDDLYIMTMMIYI